MELNASERVFLIELLREHPAGYIVLKLINRVLGELSLSPEEWTRVKAVTGEDGNVRWNPKLAEEYIKDIKIDEILVGFVASKLRELDSRQQLTWQHYTLYEKFVEGDKGEQKKDG